MIISEDGWTRERQADTRRELRRNAALPEKRYPPHTHTHNLYRIFAVSGDTYLPLLLSVTGDDAFLC